MGEREGQANNRDKRQLATSGVRRLSSTELFRDSSRVEIEHRGTTYRLQITRQGKLILTK